uniref:Transmembrane protein n=1 Tax=Caenorhabditis tropicalis TaxID=1561998 RepID=A0A1I7UF05_9PELO
MKILSEEARTVSHLPVSHTTAVVTQLVGMENNNQRKNLEEATICLILVAYCHFLRASNNELTFHNPNGGRFVWLGILLDILIELIKVGSRPFFNGDQLEIGYLVVCFASVLSSNHLFY